MALGDVDANVLRATFDEAPELYDRLRPVAPPQLFDDLTALARLEPGSRVLEIGCGTGQATLPLAERGLRVVAVELGEHLAEFTRAKLARFRSVSVVTSPFEDWDAGGDRFDAVVSFNAFHWIDPQVRFAKSARLLRDRGTLAIVVMRYVMPDDPDPVWAALQEDYNAVLGRRAASEAPPNPLAVEDRSAEIEASRFFEAVAVRRYQWDVVYDADGYVDLLRTSSWHRRLDEDARRRLFDRIRDRIAAHPAQAARPTLLATLHVARRSEPAGRA